jgi:peptidoglycan/xylan/chitin deacetylase (PgdA/CDA1 family)
MSSVFLLIGFDTERPYGKYADSIEGFREREENFQYINKLGDLFDQYKARRTFFILGEYLEKSSSFYSESEIRKIFHCSGTLVDIQQHTYTHSLVQPLNTIPDKTQITPEMLQTEIIKTKKLIHKIFRREVIGLRLPIGFPNGIKEKNYIIQSIVQSGMKFVSSDLRDVDESPNPPLIIKNGVRNPYWLNSNLLEIPGHGWQDYVFARDNLYLKFPQSSSFIAETHLKLFQQALSYVKSQSIDIFIGLMLHPWAMKEYDPHLIIMKRILNFTGLHDVRLISYKDAFELFRQS